MSPEAKLKRKAASQHLVFTTKQAFGAGMTEAAIRSRVARGLWIRLHQGVYISADIPVGWQQRIMAACLAGGHRAVASFQAAAKIWGLLDDFDVPHVTVEPHVRLNRKGFVVHRASVVIARRDGFWVTTPIQTLIDLAGVLPARSLEAALDRAHRMRLVDLRKLRAQLSLPANRSKPGTRELREMVRARAPDRRNRSEGESLLFHTLRKVQLPLPEADYKVVTRRGVRYIDYAYPQQRLGIEMDGFQDHGTPASLSADRARQNDIEEVGFRFRRFTWDLLERNPIDVAVTIGLALDLMPKRWGANSTRRPSLRGARRPSRASSRS